MSTSSAAPSTRQHVLLKDIRPLTRQVDIEVITLQQEGEPVNMRDGAIIRKFLVADLSGVMILSVWGALGDYIQTGDILRVTDVQSKVRAGQHHLATSKMGKIKRLGQDTFPFAESPNFSEVEPGSNIPPSRLARAAGAVASQGAPPSMGAMDSNWQQLSAATGSNQQKQQHSAHHYPQPMRNPGNRRGNGPRHGERHRGISTIDNRQQIPSPTASPASGPPMNSRDPRKRQWEQ